MLPAGKKMDGDKVYQFIRPSLRADIEIEMDL
jgi:hypothetical protein